MSGAFGGGAPDGAHCGASCAPAVASLIGPHGADVPMAAPYNVNPPGGEAAARAMLAQSMPLELVQQAGFNPAFGGPGLMQAQAMGACPPGGCAPVMGPPGLPPPPGLPGMGGGGPIAGAVAAIGALGAGAPGGGAPPGPFCVQRTEVRFVGPAGMKISWYAPSPDGKAGFGSQFLEAPARYNFMQASIYRLKLSDIPGRPGVELYPTLEVVPAKVKTATFLAHSAVPVCFTEEDFEQVAAGNYVVKVIYLPDPQFQDVAAPGCPDEVVSSRLEPGVDPITEAQRRGCILLVVRLGNIDLEAPNTPAMDAPSPWGHAMAPQPPLPPQMGAGMAGPLPGSPYGPVMPYQPTGARPPTTPGAPNQLPSSLPAMSTPGAAPAQPTSTGVPVGQATPKSSVEKVSYQPAPGSSRPTTAFLAGQTTGVPMTTDKK
jgi:hypothetical protein